MKAKSFLNYNVDIQKQDEHIEEFKQSVVPKEIRVDDTDRLEKGMIIPPTDNSRPLMIMDVLKIIANSIKKEPSITVTWKFSEGNEDLEEQGEEFGEILGIPIELVEI